MEREKIEQIEKALWAALDCINGTHLNPEMDEQRSEVEVKDDTVDALENAIDLLR